MNSLLEHLSIFTWMNILESNEKCASLLGDLELIPTKNDHPPSCPKCSGPMKVIMNKKLILRWGWICKKRKKKTDACRAIVSPLSGTLFENIHVPLMDAVALIFAYFLKLSVVEVQEHLVCWRKSRNQNSGSNKRHVIGVRTIVHFYSQFDKIIVDSLTQMGEIPHNKEKCNREKLLQKYKKTLKTEPFYRNIVFQFLMDIKSKFPCFKKKVTCENENSNASKSSTSANNLTNASLPTNANSQLSNQSSSETNLNVSTSILSPASNSLAVGASIVPTTTSTIVPTTTSNIIPVSTNTHTVNTATSVHTSTLSNHHAASIGKVVKLIRNGNTNAEIKNIMASNNAPSLTGIPCTSGADSLNDNIGSNFRSPIIEMDDIMASNNVPSSTGIPCISGTDSLNVNIDSNFRNPNIEMEDVMASNNAPSSTDISYISGADSLNDNIDSHLRSPSIEMENIMILNNATSSVGTASISRIDLLNENFTNSPSIDVFFDDINSSGDVQFMDIGYVETIDTT